MVKALNLLGRISFGVALTVGLSACGGSKQGSSSDQASTTSSAKPVTSGEYAPTGNGAWYPGAGGEFCKENPTDPTCIDYRFGRAQENLCNPKYYDIHGGNPDCAVKNDYRRANPDWNGNNPRTNGKT